jgi:hypothetical protein
MKPDKFFALSLILFLAAANLIAQNAPLTGSTKSPGNTWNISGNAGTNKLTNFLGTIDNQDLVFKRNNVRAGLLNIRNTSWGVNALNSAGSGTDNTAVGIFALAGNTAGFYNTAMGSSTLLSNSTGNGNTGIGAGALLLNTTGNSNVAIGTMALYNNIRGSKLVAIGDSALYNNRQGATKDLEGIFNTATGSKSLFSNTLGSNNTANGFETLTKNTTGYANTAFGANALHENTTGTGNIAIGIGTLFLNTVGEKNTAIGYLAGCGNPAASGNIFIGPYAGYEERGSNKLCISNSESNAKNPLIYGDFNDQSLQVNNRLGIGLMSNGFPLELKAKDYGTYGQGLIKFYNSMGDPKWHIRIEPNGGLGFTESFIADKRLVINPGGNLGIGRTPTTNKLEVEGTASNSTGSWLVNSDSRLKKYITPINGEDVLEKLLQLKGITYEWNDDKTGYNRPGGLQYGFTAQNVQQVFPSLVAKDNLGYLQTSYSIYDPMFVEALRALNEKVRVLEEKDKIIASQEERISKLEKAMSSLLEKKQ